MSEYTSATEAICEIDKSKNIIVIIDVFNEYGVGFPSEASLPPTSDNDLSSSVSTTLEAFYPY